MRNPLGTQYALVVTLMLGCLGSFAAYSAYALPVIDAPARAQHSEVELPDNRVTLQVSAKQDGDHAVDGSPNPLTYRWALVSGPPSAEVSFSPNGDTQSDTTVATFDSGHTGTYTFRVVVSDGVGESVSLVDVNLESRRANTDPAGSKFRPERRGDRTFHTRIDRVIVGFETPGDARVGSDRFSASSQAILEARGAALTKTWMRGRLGLIECVGEMHDRAALDDFLGALEALPEIRYAEPDDSIELNFTPNDPRFAEQVALENPTGVDIAAILAWDQTTGSSNTLVAVMDSGVDYTHPDLYLAIAINEGEIPAALLSQIVDTNANGLVDFYDLNSLDSNGSVVLDGGGNLFNETLTSDTNSNGYIDAEDLRVPAWLDGIDDDANSYVDDLTGWDSLTNTNDPMDQFGHGTHATGILAARGNNGIGIAGVDWRARILPERFWATTGGSSADAIAAIDHAVLLGADVISASWGTFTDSTALRDAIIFAGANDVVVVVAAGNQGNDIGNPADAYYPAAYTGLTNLISVASVTSSGALASSSNFGLTTVDIGAPGTSVLSTQLGGGYGLDSGTSFAVPHVTGAVSLLAGLFPGQTADWLVSRVLSTAAPLASLAGTTVSGGMVNVFAAVNTVNTAGPRVLIADPIGDVVGPVSQVILTFDRPMSAATFTVADVTLDGPSGPIVPTSVNALSGTELSVVFPAQTESGLFTLIVGPNIEDSLTQNMDQDRDGIAGEPGDDVFSLVFDVLPPPSAVTIDNGDAGYLATSGWSTFSGGGLGGDFDFITAGSGTETATWTLGGLAAGDYQLAVTWDAFSNRAIDATYTVLDGSMSLGTFPVNQTQAPADFVDGGVAWHDLGVFTVTGDSLVVELSDLAGPGGSIVVADAIRVENGGGVVLTQELQVLVDGTNIPDGTGSVDFGSTVVGTPVSRVFSVLNVGGMDLSLGSITLPSGFNLVSGLGSTLLSAGQSTSFTVELDATAEGTPSGVLSFDNNDANEDPFDITVSGAVGPVTQPEPEIVVSVGGIDVVDGTGTVDFGTTEIGSPVTLTIAVANTGTADLSLGAITLPAEFSLFAGFGSTLLSPGQSTDFVVQLDAVTVGSQLGSVSFGTNDADENPFDFIASGVVTPPPPPSWTIDDGDAGYTATAGWTPFAGPGAQGDIDFVGVGTGTQVATWTESGLATGQYRVSVTWDPFSNRAQDAPFTVLDGAAAMGTFPIDQRVAPVGFDADGVTWQELGVFPLNGDTLVVELTDLAGPPGSFVIADAVRFERLGDLPSGPEVNVLDGALAVLDGTGTVDFGTTSVGAPLTRTMTVANVGTTDLTLGAITIPADFSLVAGFGATVLVAGQTTDFVVQMDALAEGTPTGVISFVSDDADENPFDFIVSGIVTPPPPPSWTIDDGDAGYSATGGWTTSAGIGYQGDVDFVDAGTGAEIATWTESGLTTGEYRVSVTWDPFSNRAQDAPYTVFDGAAPLGTFPIDQQLAPVGFDADGATWQELGVFQLNGDTLVVELTDLAGPPGTFVIADAVRFDRIGDLPPGPELSVENSGAMIADGAGVVDFGTTVIGAPLTRTITVSNVGTTDLTLGAISMPADFSLVAGFGATLLVPGQSTDFVVQMDALVEGTPLGVVSFVSDDADENPFDFTVSGTVAPEMLPVWIIDDGDPEYSATAGWIPFTGGGAQGDLDYAFATVGSGSESATWTLSGLMVGEYRVSVTWEEFTNRSVDAPYSVLDGAIPLGTVPVDQTLSPSSFVEDGIAWLDIGNYLITGDTLVVELNNLAGPPGSIVIADAVRIERIGAPPIGPEVSVSVGGASIADGTGIVDFGTTMIGAPLTRTITVSNVGTTDLTLGAITLPADFSLMADFGATLLVPGQSTDFVVQMDALVESTPSGVVSFVTDDVNENPFDFTVSGTVVTELLPIWIVDDGDPDYSATTGWISFNGGGAQDDLEYAFSTVAPGIESATWTVGSLTAGEYRVSVSWEEFTNRSVDAPYSVLDGAVPLGTVLVDQTLAPSSFVEDGVAWLDIGNYLMNGDTLVVQLSNEAGPPGSIVIADAVRVERIGPLPIGPEIHVLAGAAAVGDGTGTVDIGTTGVGMPLTQTITVSNIGTADLALGAITVPADFSLIAGFGSTLLLPGQTTDFVVQLDALVVGVPSGVISFGSNDADEDPFDFTLSGTVLTELLPTWVIDNGDAGYTRTGPWSMWTQSGAQGDFDYTDAGTGSDTARWTQGGLATGQYRVSVTWEEYVNRAVDTPYTVLDGAVVLETVAVDQTLVPTGFVEDGVIWQELGVYSLNGDTLAVEVSNLATPQGSRVIADAVHLERIGDLPNGNLAPEVTITTPVGVTEIDEGDPLDLIASAVDPEDGDVSASTVWVSSIDGIIGVGVPLTISSLSVGMHDITASATDSLGESGTDQTTVTVPEPGVVPALMAGVCLIVAQSRRRRKMQPGFCRSHRV